jgi:hypothetical protein
MKNKLIVLLNNKDYSVSVMLIFIVILVFWLLILITSGSLFSGYHFTDDHEIVAMNYDLKIDKINIIELFIQWIKRDLISGRLRPFYYIHRIIETRVFGLNFTLWSIYTGLLGVFTTFFLFLFGKLINFSTQEALLFSFLTTLGTQSAIWWQLGPAETIGSFLLSVTLVLAVLSEKENHKLLYEILLIVLVLMMSLSKESFILIIPAIAFIKIWMSHHFQTISWQQAIVQNFLSIALLGSILLSEIIFLIFFLGLTPDIGYAGIDKFSISRIISAAKELHEAGDGWILLASLLAILVLSMRNSFPAILRTLKSLCLYLSLFFLVAFPQIVLYAKSGISHRYILPGIIGYSFLLIALYSLLNRKYRLVTKLILVLILISLGLKFTLAWEAAHSFALEGKSTNALLETIEKNTTGNDPILIVTNPTIYYEWSFSIKKYLGYVSQRNNLYLNIYGNPQSKFYREVESFYNFKNLDKINNKIEPYCIVTFPEMKKIFLKNSSNLLLLKNYKEYKFNHFNRNLNKNSSIYLYCIN